MAGIEAHWKNEVQLPFFVGGPKIPTTNNEGSNAGGEVREGGKEGRAAVMSWSLDVVSGWAWLGGARTIASRTHVEKALGSGFRLSRNVFHSTSPDACVL